MTDLLDDIIKLKRYKLSNPSATIKQLEEAYKSQDLTKDWTLVYVIGSDRDRLLAFTSNLVSYQEISQFPLVQQWAGSIWEMIIRNYYDEEQEKIAKDQEISINDFHLDQLVLPLASQEQLILELNSIHSLTDIKNRLVFSSPEKTKSFYQQMLKVIIESAEDFFHYSSNHYPSDWLEINLAIFKDN